MKFFQPFKLFLKLSLLLVLAYLTSGPESSKNRKLAHLRNKAQTSSKMLKIKKKLNNTPSPYTKNKLSVAQRKKTNRSIN